MLLPNDSKLTLVVAACVKLFIVVLFIFFLSNSTFWILHDEFIKNCIDSNSEPYNWHAVPVPRSHPDRSQPMSYVIKFMSEGISLWCSSVATAWPNAMMELVNSATTTAQVTLFAAIRGTTISKSLSQLQEQFTMRRSVKLARQCWSFQWPSPGVKFHFVTINKCRIMASESGAPDAKHVPYPETENNAIVFQNLIQ